MVAEVFRMINEFPRYDVSNFGLVRNRRTGRLMKAGDNGAGYLIVWLYKNKKRYAKSVHRLVCEAFIDNPNNYECCDHIDRCKTNNHVSNLRWVTHSMNNKNRKTYGKVNVSGVSWDENARRYQAQITDFNHKQIRKSFSIARYGNKGRALQHARIWRKAMEREYGYL